MERKNRLLVVLTKHVCLPVFFLLLVINVSAQKVVTGVIKDNTSPLAGATVNVKGTNVTALTGVDGAFTITVPQGRSNSCHLLYWPHFPGSECL